MNKELKKCSFDEFEKASYEEWKKAAVDTLDGSPFEKKLITRTYESIELQPLYYSEDINGDGAISEYPGFYNYLRSATSFGYKGKMWEICQDIPYPEPHNFNKSAKSDIANGADALYIRLNHSFNFQGASINSEPNLFAAGLLLNTLEDFETAFDGIDLTKTRVYFDPAMQATAFASAFKAYLENTGYEKTALYGSIDFDPHSHLLAQGKCCELESAYSRMALLINWLNENIPNYSAFAIHGSTFNNAGANAVQELAFALSSATAYIRGLMNNNLTIDVIAKKMKVVFGVGSNFFMEIAKLRAARTLFAKVIKEFGGSDNARKIKIHCVNSLANRTKLDSYTNMLRSSLANLASALGTADVIQIGGFDEAIGLPDDFSRRTARNTQNVIREESHITDTIDPAGGSWYIENLTRKLAEQSWKLFVETEKAGGFISVVKSGFIQNEIEKIAEARISNLAIRKDILVGVNKYPNLNERKANTITLDPIELSQKYFQHYHNNLKNRNNNITGDLVNKAGIEIKQNNSDALTTAKDAVKAGAAVFELVESFCSNVEWLSAKPLKQFRMSEIFENLRARAENYKTKNSSYPKVLLLNYGAVRDWKARSDFSFDFFLVGGFSAVSSPSMESVEEAVKYVKANDYPVVVICSSDDKYPTFVPDLAETLKSERPNLKIVLAGLPKDYAEKFTSAGVDVFIHIKANIYEVLNKLMNELGM